MKKQLAKQKSVGPPSQPQWLTNWTAADTVTVSKETVEAEWSREVAPETAADSRLRLFRSGMSFVCDNRFMSPITLHYPEFSRAWRNTIKCD